MEIPKTSPPNPELPPLSIADGRTEELAFGAFINTGTTHENTLNSTYKLLDEFDAAAGALGANPNAESELAFYALSNTVADNLSAELLAVSEDERQSVLLDLTDRLTAAIPDNKEGSAVDPISRAAIDHSLAEIVGRYSYDLDFDNIPVDSLLKLTELSLVGANNSTAERLVQTVYRRCHNDMFGKKAPEFTRQPTFTSALLNSFLSKAL